MLVRVTHASGAVAYRSPALAAIGVPHAFTTRVGGEGRELDLAAPDPRDLDAVRELAGGHEAMRFVAVRQVHGAAVFDADGAPPRREDAADALVATRPDRLLVVHTADCVPVLVASADGRRVAAVHAGWRGIVHGVIPAALAALAAPRAVAAIGPCLSLEACEMGPEVVELFLAAELGAAVRPRSDGRAHVDVRLAARMQLERGGVTTIDVSDACTWSDARELFSYRRDVTHGGAQRTGRLGALIAARAN